SLLARTTHCRKPLPRSGQTPRSCRQRRQVDEGCHSTTQCDEASDEPRNCSLVSLYDGPDKHAYLSVLSKPVFDQLNLLRDKVVTLDESSGLRMTIQIHAGGDTMSLQSLRGLGGPNMIYACVLCLWEKGFW
ncbi:hypothetical protein PENTCL1PPCAC_6639, partial [Pristionchus entomophagus]